MYFYILLCPEKLKCIILDKFTINVLKANLMYSFQHILFAVEMIYISKISKDVVRNKKHLVK